MSFASLRASLSRLRRRTLSHRQMVKLTLGLIIVGTFGVLAYTFLSPLFRIGSDLLGPVNVISVVLPPKETLKNTEGRTNILLMGSGGANHDGGNLTDTILVLSARTVFAEGQEASNSAVYLISIPRDLYLDSLRAKINTAYEYGEEREKGGGLALAKGAVTEVTGLPIHYSAKLDFVAFEKIINLVGGIDVTVERTFDDYLYPIAGKEEDTCGFSPEEVATKLLVLPEPDKEFPCRFEHLHFDAGVNHMDGPTALKYVRSRHALGDEGSDFARAKRQQQVISAMRGKLLSSETLLNPSRIEAIYKVVKTNVDTDMDASLTKDFMAMFLRYKDNLVLENIVLDFNQLYNPPVDQRGWILLPKTGSFEEIQQMIKSRLEGEQSSQGNNSSSN